MIADIQDFVREMPLRFYLGGGLISRAGAHDFVLYRRERDRSIGFVQEEANRI